MSNEPNVSQSVTAFDMCTTSGTNVAQFYLYFKYKWRSQHGEITALEDSKAAPQKLNHQPFAKNQN